MNKRRATGVSENFFASPATPAAVVDGWKASTFHCQNMMREEAQGAGIGYIRAEGRPWTHYWTAVFGNEPVQ